VIVTKDADFLDQLLLSDAPPWVVQLCCGNLRARALWALLPVSRAVLVYAERLETLD
jgi:predicted nuclease of predicted toxin-antitoxin system